jgi:predicted nucleotidyltransferase
VNIGVGRAANTALLEQMVGLLGDVVTDLVFVGGCATGLFVNTVRAEEIRVTSDVDVVAEVTTVRQYHALEKRLAARGFRPDPEVICRWRLAGQQLDVMPSGPDVLGFSNPWYPLAFATANSHVLPSGRSIRLVTSPLFLATKLAAFRSRGASDYLASHDLEDIVSVVDGRAELLAEVALASAEVRSYLRLQLGELLAVDAFVTALPGHLPGDSASQARLPMLVEKFRRLATA